MATSRSSSTSKIRTGGACGKLVVPVGKVVGMLGSTGRQLKQFGWIHEMACPSENEIYVAEILNWRVQKLILHPEQQRAGVESR